VPNPPHPPKSGGPGPAGPASGSPRLAEAHAPYNFVPLPARVAAWQPPPAADRYHADRYTGHLDLTITAETPLYLRGTVGPDNQTSGEHGPEFFSPTGRPAIPGSSLRGMLRTLVEIVSASAFEQVANGQHGFRAVADARTALGREYRARLEPVRAGHLRRTASGWEILPAGVHAGQHYWQVRFDIVQQQLGVEVAGSDHDFQRHRVQFQPTDQRCSEKSRYACIRDLQTESSSPPTGWVTGWLVVSGFIEKKAHAWIIADADERAAPRPIAQQVMDEYRQLWSDKLQELQEGERFRLLPEAGDTAPCFYTSGMRDGTAQITAIGHTRWFQSAYRKRIHDAAPTTVREFAGWDVARALFGRVGSAEQTWAGRVYVEDAPLQGDPAEHIQQARYRKILAAPKLTTVQHYLEQPAGPDSAALRHWDSPDTRIRGYKLYWHHKEARWIAEPRETPAVERRQPEQQQTVTDAETKKLAPELIQPAVPGSRFRGRVRFENLAAEELGALLFVLKLPESCRHRLGMGKPLGMGSIRIDTTLRLDSRVDRYRRLFGDADGAAVSWWEPELEGDASSARFQRDFATWLVGAVGGSAGQPDTADPTDAADATDAAWRLDRLQALQALLTWDRPLEDRLTSYMQIEPANEFSARPVLPDAIAVIGWERPTISSGASRSPAAGPTQPTVPPRPGGMAPSSPSPPPTAAGEPPAAPPAERRAEPPPAATLEAGLEALRQRFSSKPSAAPKQPARTRQDERALKDQQRLLDDQRRPKPR